MTNQYEALRAACAAALDYLSDDCEAHWSPEQRDVVDSLRRALQPLPCCGADPGRGRGHIQGCGGY